MTPELVAKVARVLPLLGSDQPGEVVATAAAVGRLLATERMGWVDLAEHLAPLPARVEPPREAEPDPDLSAWTSTIRRCIAAGAALRLPAREYNFLYSLLYQVQNRQRAPSTKQRAWLVSIAERLGVV